MKYVYFFLFSLLLNTVNFSIAHSQDKDSTISFSVVRKKQVYVDEIFMTYTISDKYYDQRTKKKTYTAPPQFVGGTDTLKHFFSKHVTFKETGAKTQTFIFNVSFTVTPDNEIKQVTIFNDADIFYTPELISNFQKLLIESPAIFDKQTVYSFCTLNIYFIVPGRKIKDN